jgi:hypothetical protein
MNPMVHDKEIDALFTCLFEDFSACVDGSADALYLSTSLVL